MPRHWHGALKTVGNIIPCHFWCHSQIHHQKTCPLNSFHILLLYISRSNRHKSCVTLCPICYFSFWIFFFYSVVMGLTACFADHTPQLAMLPKTAVVILGPKPRNESHTFLKPEEKIWRSRYTRNNSGRGPLYHGIDNVTNKTARPFTETTATYWIISNVWKVKPTAALAEMWKDGRRNLNDDLFS